MLITLDRWISDNGNYMVKLMGFKHDEAEDYDVRCFKRNDNGKYVTFHGKNLPQYVLRKIIEMRKVIPK